MKTTRLLTLKLVKRLRHQAEVYQSYLRTPQPIQSLPARTLDKNTSSTPPPEPLIFFSPDERTKIAAAAQQHSPQRVKETIEWAEQICAGKIEIFGHQLNLLEDTPWHSDPTGGRTWPKIPSPRISVVYSTDASDIKIPWELARFQYLSILGRAGAYTGEEKYGKQARALIESFQRQNPLGLGLHWLNPMEAAIRATNWIFADSYFSGTPAWDEKFRHQLKLALYDHGRFIRTHLERDGRGINNNHYTANLTGLFAIGLFLGQRQETLRWTEFALRELTEELHTQIADDGMHYENSFGYHRLTFEMFLHTYRLALLNGYDCVAEWSPTLIRMAEFVLSILTPTGKVPNFGDNDDGIWLAGSRRTPDDLRYLVLLATAAWNKPDLWLLPSPPEEIPEDIYWQLGYQAAEDTGHKLTQVREQKKKHALIRSSRIFETSGIAVLHAPDAYVLISANPVGTGGAGGHKHNDLLSFVFTARGNEIVIDPGTYTYTGQPVLRNLFRSTRAHNTVTINDAEQNRFLPGQLFWLHQDAHPQINHWESDDKFDQLVVGHDGYHRLPGRITHSREFRFDKERTILVIRDRLTGAGSCDICQTINFGPGALNVDDPEHVILTLADNLHHAGFCFSPGMSWRVSVETGWRSQRYHQKIPLLRLVRCCRAELPISWTTSIGISAERQIDWTLLAQSAEFPEGEATIINHQSISQSPTVIEQFVG